MRQVVVAEYLQTASPEAAVATLYQLVQGSLCARDSDCAVALDSLTGVLADPALLSYERRATLYAAAKRADQMIVARLFFDASPGLAQREELAEARPLRPRGRPLTLGERKSLARSPRRQVLVAIIRDPHPDVTRIALGNPHITESDVVQMAARRPAPPEMLAVIANAPRWRARYPVKRALVKNPHTPSHLAVRLLTTLRRSDVRAVALDSQLSRPVREHARALMDVQIHPRRSVP